MQRGASEKKKKAVAVVEPNKGGEAEVEAEAQPKQVIASVAQLVCQLTLRLCCVTR